MRAATDFDEIVSTDRTVVGEPMVLRPTLGGGPFHASVRCPLCRCSVDLYESLRGPEARCAECTVIVRLDGNGKAKACGWMGGGDMLRASAPLRRRRSKFDEPKTVTRPRPKKKKRKVAPCPSDAAYQRHLRNGEAPCPGCEKAHRAQSNKRRRASRARARAELEQVAA